MKAAVVGEHGVEIRDVDAAAERGLGGEML
jgi:hypothetical protein